LIDSLKLEGNTEWKLMWKKSNKNRKATISSTKYDRSRKTVKIGIS
jgi:hypothetical protein